MLRLSRAAFLAFFLLFTRGSLAGSTQQSHSYILAFPGAEGFGAYATGGRGGEVRHVTNLQDAGTGSFRDAVARPNAIVVFDLAGSIDLKSTVVVASNLTIAGQSAPGQGICLSNYMVDFGHAHEDIVRYLRFRVGIDTHQDHKYSVGMYGAHNMIFDHCSIEWGGWDCIGMTAADNMTVQFCIIGPGVNPQKFGCLCQSNNVTFSHNLWISNKSRSPKAKGTIQYINNIVYNWGVCGLVGGHSLVNHQLDVINNYFIKGPDSGDNFTGEYFATDQVYQSGNMVDLDRSGKLQGHLAAAADFAPATMVKSLWMKPAVPVTLDTAQAAYDKVIASAGDSLHRDSVDRRLIDEVRSLGIKGELIGGPDDAGFKTEIPSAKVSQVLPAGAGNLEHYLNELAQAGK